MVPACSASPSATPASRYSSDRARCVALAPRSPRNRYPIPDVWVSRCRIVTGRRAGTRRKGPSPSFARREDVECGQRGKILSHRIVELEAPLLVQHHDRDARDRLRHRGDPKDRVNPHRRTRGSVGHAVGSYVSLAAFPRHQGDRPPDRSVVHVALHDLLESGQTRFGETNVRRRNGRKPLRPSGCRDDRTHEQYGDESAYAHRYFLCTRFVWLRHPAGRGRAG